MFAENGEDVQLQAFNCEHGSKLSEGRINCAEVSRRFQAMLVRRNGQKKKRKSVRADKSVWGKLYTHTKKKNIRDAVGQLARPLESLWARRSEKEQ